jgi:hypothetical protein
LTDEHDEFITALASNDVLGAGDTAATGGKGLEGAIADMVTMGIVDGLEAIDIEQQQRDPAASPLRPGDLAFSQRSELELKVPHAQTREEREEGRLMFQTLSVPNIVSRCRTQPVGKMFSALTGPNM